MKLTNKLLAAAVAIAAVGLVATDAAAQGKKKKHKIKPTVTFAKTWETAIEEGKLLNLPIVVHSHGFY